MSINIQSISKLNMITNYYLVSCFCWFAWKTWSTILLGRLGLAQNGNRLIVTEMNKRTDALADGYWHDRKYCRQMVMLTYLNPDGK